MVDFRHVLVAVSPGRLDGSCFHRIGEMAAADHAAVTLLDVVEPLPAWRRVVNVEGRAIDIGSMMMTSRQEALVRQAGSMGIPDVQVVVKTGKPAVEAIRHVQAEGCDLVVVGEAASSDGHLPGLSAGVMQLLRKCPVPVWVMRPCRSEDVRILALVDPDPSDPVRDGLNDAVLDMAVSITRRRDGELHVAHAWTLPGESAFSSSPFLSIPPVEIEMMLHVVEDEHRSRFDSLIYRHAVSDVGGIVHLVQGDPGKVLPELARHLGVNLIVMGTVARTGLAGLIMGNTAEAILRSVSCSVLAIKPAGFVSPVH
jgi:universal stress protein E